MNISRIQHLEVFEHLTLLYLQHVPPSPPRSRIQNLPNYKKTNLGENMQFIVVFQTIEI